MGIIERIIKLRLQEATIVRKEQLSSAAYHIRIQSDKIKEASFVPGYFLRLAVGLGREQLSLGDIVRSYTVWDIDQSAGTIDLAIATHSKGIGTSWAMECEVGDELYFTWHKGKFLVDDTADSYLMIGDLSALAHLYMIRRRLRSDKIVKGIFYSPNQGELFNDIDGTATFSFYKMPENPGAEILALVNRTASEMTGKRLVYIAGDSRLCVSLNQYFRRELHWKSKEIKTKPFWNPNKKGLE